MDELWEPLFERLALVLRKPENLVVLLSALEKVQKETGYGSVSIIVDGRQVVQVNETIKRKPIESRMES